MVAACALLNASQDIRDGSVPIDNRIASLESGELFEHAGILNMLTGDFFSWYADDPNWNHFAPHISRLTARLAGIDFNVSRKTAQSTRDLFKGIYESFVPRALRHALGEFYTPDWLAEHGLDTIGWRIEDDLLDPTCGSGTFLLDAIRRRLQRGGRNSAAKLLRGISGIDLNPLAVLTAKGSLAVFVAPYLDPANPVRLPVYLADAINPASKGASGNFEHTLQTEVGKKTFKIPGKLIQHCDFYRIFARIRMLIDAEQDAKSIDAAIQSEFNYVNLAVTELQAVQETIATLVDLHCQGWNGIWCSIIADRFAAGAIHPVAFICGNPPWVKWSHLPPEYAKFIKPRCLSMGVFSTDRWVGGIESDISTVITYEAIDKYLAPSGVLGFFITGTVFTNESSEGFRKFSLHKGKLICKVELVEDFNAIKPFDGVSNHSTFLMVRRDAVTTFPVTYRMWSAVDGNGKRVRSFDDAGAFRATATHVDYLAEPVPGGKGARPWLVGTAIDHGIFKKVFASTQQNYEARKGVTSDRNGIFWVHVLNQPSSTTLTIKNAADIGKTKGIPSKTAVVETDHIFPMLRGRGVAPFSAIPDPDIRMLVPQRGMHGDPNLAISHPMTYRFLSRFKPILEARSSFKRFQEKGRHPYYSLWSTGPYTFSPFKVLWREMSGKGFAVAYTGSVLDPVLGNKVVIPDHKLYFHPD